MFVNIYKEKRVLITGNTGFKGSWLTTWLLKLGAKVYGLSNDIPTQPSMFEALRLEDKITYFEEDIRRGEKIVEIVSEIQPDFVFHLAAQPLVSLSYTEPIPTLETNILGTSHLLEALRRWNLPCVAVIITSDKCYENVEWTWGYRESDRLGGKDPYSASKAAAELVVRTYYHSFFKKDSSRIKVVSVRAGNVIGGGDWADHRIVPDCIRAWSQGKPVVVRRPEATRPWQHVLEPLSGYLHVGQVLHDNPGISGESYNFGPSSHESYTVLTLLKEIGRHGGFQEQGKMFVVSEDSHNHEAALLKLNCDKALHELQWKPTLDFKQMAAFTSAWYRRYDQHPEGIFEFTQQQIHDYCALAQAKGLAWTQEISAASF